MKPEALLAAAERGDELPREIIDNALRTLARGLHAMSVLAYPELVTIGGGFMASDWLLEELRRHVSDEGKGYLGATLTPAMVERASLGNEAGMIGAARRALEKFG